MRQARTLRRRSILVNRFETLESRRLLSNAISIATNHVVDGVSALPLQTGPSIAFSTFLGGMGYDAVNDVAVGLDGSVYVTGQASTNTFPATPGAFQTDSDANNSAFVTKYNPNGSLAWSTLLSGGLFSHTVGHGIAVDSSGSAYVTGEVSAAEFPITPGAYADPAYDWDVFVTKLTPDGSGLVYSARIGGEWEDFGRDIAVGSDGSAYITGHTFDHYFANPRDFPTTPGALQTAFGSNDTVQAFVTKLNPQGSALVYSTLLGGGTGLISGSAYDYGEGIAVDDAGNAYVIGDTRSTDFPTTSNAFDRTLGGAQDAFVVKLNTTGSALIYGSYLGGNFSEVGGRDYGRAIAIDDAGHAYITGFTDAYRPTDWTTPEYGSNTANFPTTDRAFQRRHSGFQSEGASVALTEEAFVTKFAPDGSSLIYSTYFGGTTQNNGNGDGMDRAWGIGIDANGFATIAGQTSSDRFPIFNALPGGSTYPALALETGFVAKLGADGSSLAYSSYLGGHSTIGRSVALDQQGNAVVVGETRNLSFPTINAAQPQNGGPNDWSEVSDGFVTRIIDSSPASQSILGLSLSPVILPVGARTNITVTLNSPAPTGGSIVTFSDCNPQVISLPASMLVPEGQISATIQSGLTTLPPNWNSSAASTIAVNLNGSRRMAMLTVTPTSFAATSTQFDVNGPGGPIVKITFNTDIIQSTLNIDDLTVTNTTTGAPATGATSVSYDPSTRTATFVLSPALANADYRATLGAGTVLAPGSVPLSPDATVDFFIMAGDVNHDRTVNFNDLLIVAQNYGQSNRSFSQGNVDYSSDGLVNFNDLLIIAQRYGTSLPSLRAPTTFGSNRIGKDVLSIE